MKLRVHPKTGQVYMDADAIDTLYSFDGTPHSRYDAANEWKIVGECDNLFAWQADPGKYGPHSVTVQVKLLCDKTHWTGGGSFVYIQSYLADNADQIVSHRFISLWQDRNTAHANAQVQW